MLRILVLFIFSMLSIPLIADSNIDIENNYLSSNDSLIKQINIHLSHSEPDISIAMLFEIINKNKINTDTLTLCKILLSEAYRQKREYKKGEEILLNIINGDAVSEYNLAYAYNRLAAIYDESSLLKSSRYDMVIKYSNLSFAISKKNGFDNLKYSSYNEIGYVYNIQGDFAKSRIYLDSAYYGFIREGAIESAITTAINLSNVYYNIGNLKEAKKVIEEAIALGDVDNQKNLYLRLYLQKAKLYKFEGDFEQAYTYLAKARRMQRSFYTDRIHMQINKMSAVYDLKLKEAKIIEEEHKNKIHEQRQLLLIIVSIVLFLVIILLVFLINQRKKLQLARRKEIEVENNLLKEKLEFKNKELTLNTMNIIRHSEFVSSLVPELKELYLKATTVNKRLIANIVQKINMHNKTELWDDFYRTFTEVNSSFFDTLNKQFPNLSVKERKLCALLKLEMNTKDIASITNTSTRGVETARLRLRKKLNLSTEDNLCVFLRKIS